MRLCDLKEKEVINVCDCKRLGCICDLDIDECDGRIKSIIIPVPGKFFCFSCKEEEYVISFKDIVQIGVDIVLVDVNLEEVLVKCKY